MIPLRFFRSLVAMCLLTLAFFAKGQAQQLSFSANTTNGCSPLIVNFTANAPGAVSYSWNLGNNTLSALANPSVTYVAGGLFNVSLTVSYADGSTQTVFESGYIEVFDPPTVDFAGSPLAICSGNDVTFTNASTPGSGPITSWLWGFGDGTTSIQQAPVHNYTLSGVFPVTLVATDINGCSTLEQKNTYIQVNNTPSADFTANNTLSCTTPFPVNFVTLVPAPGTTHIWNLGNGANPVVSNPTTTYNTTGNYSVTHIVTDAIGCSDTVIKTNYIQVGSPTINIQVSANSICAGQSVGFNCGAAPGSIVNWNFGNGQTSNSCSPTIFYPNPGTFVANVTITDPSGCTYGASQAITVNPNPVADFTIADTVLCNPPHEANFTALGNPANLYTWTFGDGTGGAGQTVTHTYPNLPVSSATGQPYFWDVSLTVKNVFGCTASTAIVDAISTGQTVARIMAQDRGGCAPRLVNFLDNSVTNSTITSWEWDFGVPGGTSTQQFPSFTYTSTGTYDVQLIIGTLHGCTDTLFASGYITAGDTPVADFLPDTTISCASDKIQMFNLSVGADSASWIFGDGKTSTTWEPLHQFVDTGYISIMLIALDRGCPDTLIVDSSVYIKGPIATLAPFSKLACDTPLTIPFQDFSLAPETWKWDFDDGSPISTLQNPVHTYTSEGTYNPKLIVENLTNGCIDSMIGVIQIEGIEASFSVDTTFGCNPVTVAFTDLSYKAISYSWKFGDGFTDAADSPGHTYTAPGYYDVELRVQNSLGCIDDTVIAQQVSVYEPQVAFQAVPAQGCAPLLVNFSNNTTSLAPVVAWQWNFGPPGATSTLQSPDYTYTTPGSWDVELTATDSIGCTQTVVKPGEVFVSQPIPDFFALYPINCPNNPVTFTNTSSGSGLSYLWDFGDNSTSGAFSPTHTYTAPGTYTVSLTVTDFQGCDSTITLVNYITIADPLISLTPDTTFADCPPLLVNFTGNGLSPHPFSTWNWDFGDGGTSAGQNPSHIYVDPGSYTVTLTATAPSGCSASFTAPSLIDINGPTGSFTIAPTSACPLVPLTFTATSATAKIFTWDFNNGVLGSGQTTNYGYPASGVYLPLLILEDSVGCVVVVPNSQPVTIQPVPQASFIQSQTTLCDTGTVAFTNTTVSTNPVTSISWDFGLGLGTSAQNNPSFFFGAIGNYDVRLIVENVFGCADTVIKPGLVVVAEPPNAELSLSDTIGCAPFAVTFTDVSIPGSSPVLSRQWASGQTPPTFSSFPQPTFVYTQPGVYLSVLEVTDQNGCVDSDTLSLEALTPPVANFAADDSFGCAPKPIQFQSLTPNIVDWEWDFGDNSPKVFIDDPLHTYFTDGTYTVTLEVTDVEGCKDTLVKPQYINLDHPVADFEISDSVICPGEPLTFSDLSLSDTSLVAWAWQFGNGDISAAQNPAYSYPGAGLYAVSLKVQDFFGCEDSITKPRQVRVREDNTPVAPPIRFVTVQSNSEIRIVFDPYENSEGDFGSYRLLQDDGSGVWTPVFESTNINDTEYTQTGLSTVTQSYCYRLEVTNYCDRPSEYIASDVHCSMLLESVSLVDAIELNWSAYEGWPVQAYEIYRVSTYDLNNISLVATVAGDLTTWEDLDMFCYDAYIYRIKAISANGSGDVSWSNIRREAPQHFGPPFQMDIEVATVEADSFVLVKWPDVPPGDNLVEVILEKDAGNGFRFWHRQGINDPQREKQDFEVDVDLRSYAYQIYVVDTCGDVTPAGNIGKTILLKAERREGAVYLDWSVYQQWDSGVDRYMIELFNESTGEFELLYTVGGGVQEYVDDKTELPQGVYCYRIVAAEGVGGRVTSTSNVSCITVDPLLYFPNAFSPNGDGYNDQFLIKGAYIERFNMEIYNRWGEKIFVSTNQGEGWDGRINGQVEAPEGTYVFKVLGVGYEGEEIHRSGTVTLFR